MRRAIALFLLALPLWSLAAAKSAQIQWRVWNPDQFAEAAHDQKLIILDLEAVWCHWCHVMDEKTYHDPEVARIINAHFIAVRVDQDAHPELSARYEDWGWPATIIFRPDGAEIAKLRGYVEPGRMAKLLTALHDNPRSTEVPGEPPARPADGTTLTADQKKLLQDRYEWVYDAENGGWGNIHKFVHTHSMEYALERARAGDKLHEVMARQTLYASLQLLDPVWGGVYQYSDETDWKSPHFEKIMSFQTDTIRLYALMSLLADEKKYLDAARSIHGYLTRFLRNPDGAFYTSQDADLNREVDGKSYYGLNEAERLKLGTPRIDRNIYARENGWVISALVSLYAATGEQRFLDEAVTAARWIIAHRGRPDGGFGHARADDGPFLGDTLAMGRAFLDLFAASGEREWLNRSIAAGKFMNAKFRDDTHGGFATSGASGHLAPAPPHIDSNIELARHANLLFQYTADGEFRAMSAHAMRFLVSPAVVDQRRLNAGVMLADLERAGDPVHLAVVGRRDDESALTLLREAIRYPSHYKRVDFWDRREGPLPNPDVRYPELDRAAAFACANKTCSLPVFERAKLRETVDRMNADTL
jgi:uncharacterized protein YyaL (SSP411 family)